MLDERWSGSLADQRAVAAPGPVLRQAAEARADWVQRHVPDREEQVRVRLDRLAVVAGIPDVPAPTALAIEPARIAGVQVLHRAGNVLLARRDEEVVVRRHEAIAAHAEPVLTSRGT